jgi:RimJ/RimL family protein N-acetyltransferase
MRCLDGRLVGVAGAQGGAGLPLAEGKGMASMFEAAGRVAQPPDLDCATVSSPAEGGTANIEAQPGTASAPPRAPQQKHHTSQHDAHKTTYTLLGRQRSTPNMATTPFEITKVALQGQHIRLEPYVDTLKEEVRAALDCDAPAWDLFAISGQGPHFEALWQNFNKAMAAGTWMAYAIRRLSDQRIVGTSSFLNIKPERQCAEIGATFLHPDVRSGVVNPEAKLLMLQHAFACGARRVELITDARNLRSQAAIAKLGAVKEGVMRRDRITWTGHIRDSVLYAITDLDWPDVQARLTERIRS